VSLHLPPAAVAAHTFAMCGELDAFPEHVKSAVQARSERCLTAALEAMGARVQIERCPCDNGRIETGPPGATYTVAHEGCKGTGRLYRLTTAWLPVDDVEQTAEGDR
jgi:hypothetical protein